MPKTPNSPHKQYHPVVDLLIVFTTAALLLTLALTTDVFQVIVRLFDSVAHEKLDEIFVALGFLNLVFIALIFRRSHTMQHEVSNGQHSAQGWERERLML